MSLQFLTSSKNIYCCYETIKLYDISEDIKEIAEREQSSLLRSVIDKQKKKKRGKNNQLHKRGIKVKYPREKVVIYCQIINCRHMNFFL